MADPNQTPERPEWACPCSGCKRAIAQFGLKRVIYTTNETGKYEVL